jgi:hypothetical protein
MSDDRGTARRMLRRFALGSGSLTRGSDRLQALARVLVVLILLTAIPVALSVATAAYSQSRSIAAAQSASRHQVTATLLEDAGTPDTESGPAAVARSTISWTGPAGTARVASVPVPPGAEAGSTLRIWIDRSGDVTRRPASRGDAAGVAYASGLLTFIAIAVAATAAYLPVRSLLDRRRMRQWAEGWAVVEPVWSRKVLP